MYWLGLSINTLQQLIIQKAADDIRQQKELEAAERYQVIESRVQKLEISGLQKGTELIFMRPPNVV